MGSLRILWERDHKGVRSVARRLVEVEGTPPRYTVEVTADQALVYRSTEFQTEESAIERAKIEFSRNVMKNRDACTRR
jgi:hypothetical protein